MKDAGRDQILITFYDFKRLFLRIKNKLKIVGWLSFLITFALLLLKEPHYLAKATFKHSTKQSDFPSQIKDFLKELSVFSSESFVFSTMQSNEVLKNVIEELGMHIDYKPRASPFFFMRRILDNLQTELTQKLPDLDSFTFRQVRFESEKAMLFYIRPLDDVRYEVLNQKKQLIAQGSLGKRFFCQELEMNLVAFPHKVTVNKLYAFQATPWRFKVEEIRKSFELRPNRIEKNVLILQFKHRDRHLASLFLNQIMASYQTYLEKENEELCKAQILYLAKRQEELTEQFDEALREHVAYLKDNVDDNGFMSFAQELQILSEPQTALTSKLFNVDLELKRLETLYRDPFAKSPLEEQSTALMKPSISNEIHSRAKDCDIEKRQLENVASLSNSSFFAPVPNSLSFGKEKAAQEFEGMTLESAKNLYLDYTRERDALQARLQQLIFLREELHNPDFELSSLSTFLTDSVSTNLVHAASAIALKMKDEENRTPRELQRLKEELDVQKNFLHHHLIYTSQMIKLQLKLISDKITSLQQHTISLLKSEQQLLQDKLTELGEKMTTLPEKWRRENLLLLKKELGTHMLEGMSQIAEAKNLTQHLYQVFSKPLDFALPPLKPSSPHLFLYSFLAAFTGAFCYYAQSLCRSLINGLSVSHENLKYSGLPSYGILSRFCDSALQELNASDLNTLRELSSFFTSSGKHICAGLITGKNPDYSNALAELLALSGLSVLVVRFVFDKPVKPEEIPGLWQYLENDHIEIPIRHRRTYDELPSGGTSRHGAEMLLHPKFLALLSQFKKIYDIVLIHSTAHPSLMEGRMLAQVADALIVTVNDEAKEDLLPFQLWAEKKCTPCLAFVCFES